MPWAIAIGAVALSWVALAAFWATGGVFSVDGFIYHAMIDAFARNGSLFVENGYDFHPSPDLRLEFLVISGDRLAPQYPGGWGILAAPAYLAAGLRGVILVNAVASALTLPLIWIAANALFRDRTVAGTSVLIYALASFAVDYAFGVWPHGVTTLLVTAAFAAVASGWRGSHHAGLRGPLLAGIAIGLAINLRVDSVLALGGIGVWVLATARKPYATVAAIGLGLLPGLALAIAINHVKFGSLSPITYGRDAGAVSLAQYAVLLPGLAAAGIGALALGLAPVRAVVFRPRAQAGLLVASLAAILLAAPLREVALQLARGIHVLVFDFQAHPMPARGLSLAEDGTIRMFGLTKKALLQSMPFAACAIVLLPRMVRGRERAPLALCLLFALCFIVFFAARTWHGGTSNNMRYFLNAVPALTILSAVALRSIAAVPERRPVAAALAQIGLLLAVMAYVQWRGFSLGFAIEHSLPSALELGIAILAVVFLLARTQIRGLTASALQGLVVLGLMNAFLSAWLLDLQVSQNERRISAGLSALSAQLPADALVVTLVTSHAGFRVNRPPAITAKADHVTGAFDASLVGHAFADGRPVYAQGLSLAHAMIATGAADAATPVFGLGEDKEFYRMAAPETGAGGDANRNGGARQ